MWKYQNTKVEYIQTNVDNPNKFAVVIKDSWRTYATYVYSDSLTTEMIKKIYKVDAEVAYDSLGKMHILFLWRCFGEKMEK